LVILIYKELAVLVPWKKIKIKKPAMHELFQKLERTSIFCVRTGNELVIL
jgi:hypothetical protein